MVSNLVSLVYFSAYVNDKSYGQHYRHAKAILDTDAKAILDTNAKAILDTDAKAILDTDAKAKPELCHQSTTQTNIFGMSSYMFKLK